MNIDPPRSTPARSPTYAAKAHDQTIVGFLLHIIPTRGVGFADGSILQVLFVAILFGVVAGLVGEPAQPVSTCSSGCRWPSSSWCIVMKAAPIGAFGAMAFTIGKYGIGSPRQPRRAGRDLLPDLAAVRGGGAGRGGAAVNGFSIFKPDPLPQGRTAAGAGHLLVRSGAAQPDREAGAAGCAKSVVGLVVPTGYSFNLDGTNIYMTLAALFIAQATGVHLSLGEQLLLLGVAMLSSKGAAGVTGAGFITLAATLSVVPSVPVAGMALILGVDRFMSECRSLTNFIGNAVAPSSSRAGNCRSR
jgi:aerobic C4-dicarboxylate transport protein